MNVTSSLLFCIFRVAVLAAILIYSNLFMYFGALTCHHILYSQHFCGFQSIGNGLLECHIGFRIDPAIFDGDKPQIPQ